MDYIKMLEKTISELKAENSNLRENVLDLEEDLEDTSQLKLFPPNDVY